MILRGKRIRKFENHFGYLKDGQDVIFGVPKTPEHKDALSLVGFPSTASVNDAVLPSARCGPVCRFNAEGKQIVRRDLPMETAYRQVEWTWKEWHGKEQVEKSDTKDVPYKRYPRDFVPPPSIEVRLAQMTNGTELVTGPVQQVNLADTAALLHTVNVFLEIFGECQVFADDLSAVIQVPVTRLNWQILPPGARPWPQLQTQLNPLLNQLSVNKRKVVSRRFETINSYQPDFVAAGSAGFSGYVVFGFTSKNLYLCESMYTGNATYVFASNWAALCQMTKAQILNNSLHEDRIIHREGWPLKIGALLG
jgi:hypothetical protein